MTSPYNMTVFLILPSIKDTVEVLNIPPPLRPKGRPNKIRITY